MVKIVLSLVYIISEHRQKEISLFETETVGSCLVLKLEWVGHGPLAPPVAKPLIQSKVL